MASSEGGRDSPGRAAAPPDFEAPPMGRRRWETETRDGGPDGGPDGGRRRTPVGFQSSELSAGEGRQVVGL